MITEETKTNVNNNYNNETRPVPYRNPDAIDLLELLYECKRRWWAILICVVVLGGVLGAILKLPGLQRSFAQAQLKSRYLETMISRAAGGGTRKEG